MDIKTSSRRNDLGSQKTCIWDDNQVSGIAQIYSKVDKDGADHQVHSDGSLHNVCSEQTDTVKGASNTAAGLDAVKSNTDEFQGRKTSVRQRDLKKFWDIFQSW